MTKKYQLKNGMKVLLLESRKSPVVSAQIWVKTGSADEKKGQEGLSHFIEHLVFKGTAKYNVGEVANAIESSGGVLNAYTSFDQTVFYVTLSKSQIDVGFDVLSEMLGRPRFDESEINNEREVVIEEIKRSLDNPHQRASRLLFSNSYKNHPYGIPVIGYAENIRNVTQKELLRFYQSRYVPQNMTLLVVGDFETKEVQKKVEDSFAHWPKRQLKKVVRKKEPVVKKPRLKIEHTDFNESLLYMAWPGPKAKNKEASALSILMMILGHGESSPLTRGIRNEKQLVNHIGASSFSPMEPGLLVLSAGLKDQNLEKTLENISLVLGRYMSEPCSWDELMKSIHQVESEKLYSLETVDGLAGLYGHFDFLYGNPDYFDQLLKEFRSIRPEDLVKVARKYIRPESTMVSYQTNKGATDSERVIQAWLKKFAADCKAWTKIKVKKTSKPKHLQSAKTWHLPKRDERTSPKKSKTSGGITLVTRKIHSSPVVSVRAGFLGGIRAEKERTRGVSELLARVWASGTKNRTEAELNRRIEEMSSSIQAFGGRNTVGLSMTALSPYFEPTFEVFGELLHAPNFVENIVEREKQQMLESLRSRADKPAQICMLNFAKEMFGNHPYGFDPLAGEEQVRALDAERIVEYMAGLISAENLIVSAVGTYEESVVSDTLQTLAKHWPRHCEFKNQFLLEPLSADRHTFLYKEKEQSHVVLGFRGLEFKSEQRYVLEIIQSILSGQGGRLFTELRDKASLAYSVAPVRMDGIDTGYFGAYIGCSPEKGKKALEMMLVEFRKLMEEPVSELELARAKKYLMGRHDISLQTTSSLTDHYFFDSVYGLPFNEIDSYKSHVEKVSAEDVIKLARQIFTQNKVISVVGKTNPLEDASF